MTIQPQDAANALKEIAIAEQHSAKAYRYQKASPHLFLWGFIWIVGYSAVFVRPSASWIWFVLTAIGIPGSFWIARRERTDRSRAYAGWEIALTLLALSLFLSAFFAIFPPRSPLQVDAIFPLMIALWYVLFGIWRWGARMALLGLALGVLTVGGYFWLQHYFLLWMAGVGGGALILGGFWLRKV
jgi:hypothetical protein